MTNASQVPTTGAPESFARYLAAWNEHDVNRVRQHLAASVSPDVLFVDPANTTVGIDELEAMIREARVAMPNADYRLSSGIDGHHGRYRYRWTVWIDGEPAVLGMDITAVDEAGRIVRIDGFFGDFAPLR